MQYATSGIAHQTLKNTTKWPASPSLRWVNVERHILKAYGLVLRWPEDAAMAIHELKERPIRTNTDWL